MALTSTVFWETASPTGTGGDITTTSRTYNSGELLTIAFGTSDNSDAGTLSIANSGTGQTWTALPVTNTSGNCKMAGWFCTMSVTQAMTVTISGSGAGAGSSMASVIAVIQHTGQHATTPVPAGNRFSGAGATDVSQVITPTSAGSSLFMIAGDWSAGNTFAARANCTLDQTFHNASFMTATLIRPTTQPLPDTSAFTLGETDTSGTIAWIAYEVQAAAAAGRTTKNTRSYTHGVNVGMGHRMPV